jgi:hypothetical protein
VYGTGSLQVQIDRRRVRSSPITKKLEMAVSKAQKWFTGSSHYEEQRRGGGGSDGQERLERLVWPLVEDRHKRQLVAFPYREASFVPAEFE